MNKPIWPGSSSFTIGSTPFGFYDTDIQFQADADKVAKFCAQRLGYPIMEVELQDINFYTAFEMAVTMYGNEIYAYKVRDNILTLEGVPTENITSLNNALITPNLGNIIRLSEQYGAEAGVGGNVTWYSGSVPMKPNVQEYDLNEWAISQSIDGPIEIKQVYYQAPPALTRFYDPYAGLGSGFGAANAINSFGFGSFSPALNFLMSPVSYDMQVLQQLELSEQIRLSNYSFELINNKLKIFPIPRGIYNLWIRYIKVEDRLLNSITYPGSGSGITNVSNVPYTNPIYTQMNSIGRSWVFEYTLALCKEMLGYVRGKYDTVPIPNSDVKLNASDLISSAAAERTALIERLRLYLDETSNKSLLERRKDESDFKLQELSKVPLTIFIG
jgi:hypothetical protein